MKEPEGPSRRGPVEPDAAGLLRRVRLLELAARRNASGLTGGDWVTSIPGQGLLFHETRKYVAGESAKGHRGWRNLDTYLVPAWNRWHPGVAFGLTDARFHLRQSFMPTTAEVLGLFPQLGLVGIDVTYAGAV